MHFPSVWHRTLHSNDWTPCCYPKLWLLTALKKDPPPHLQFRSLCKWFACAWISLRSTWLAIDLLQKPTWSKPSLAGLNVNVEYVEFWRVPTASHVSCVLQSYKKKSSASEFILFFGTPLCTHFKLTFIPTLIYHDKNNGVEVELFIHCKEIRDKRRQCFGPKHSPIRHCCGSPPFTSIV